LRRGRLHRADRVRDRHARAGAPARHHFRFFPPPPLALPPSLPHKSPPPLPASISSTCTANPETRAPPPSSPPPPPPLRCPCGGAIAAIEALLPRRQCRGTRRAPAGRAAVARGRIALARKAPSCGPPGAAVGRPPCGGGGGGGGSIRGDCAALGAARRQSPRVGIAGREAAPALERGRLRVRSLAQATHSAGVLCASASARARKCAGQPSNPGALKLASKVRALIRCSAHGGPGPRAGAAVHPPDPGRRRRAPGPARGGLLPPRRSQAGARLARPRGRNAAASSWCALTSAPPSAPPAPSPPAP
jgi:hypothetical protein